MKQVVIYGEANMNPTTCVATGPPLINGLTTTNIIVTSCGRLRHQPRNSYSRNHELHI